MHAAKAGTRTPAYARALFSLGAAAVGYGLVLVLNRIWGSLFDAMAPFGSYQIEAATVALCGYFPAAVYWLHSLLMAWRTDFNMADEARKVQPGKGPTRDNYWAGAPLVLFNTLVLGPALTFAAVPAWRACWGWFGWTSEEARLEQLPTLPGFLASLVFFLAVEEVGFYYTHLLAHHKVLYPYIHKIHHQYTAPVAYCAVYAHPLEHIVVNVAPVVAGPVLLGSHPVTAAAWIVMALVYTTNSHCGWFLLPYGSPEGHDWHHSHFNEVYGVVGVLDWLHGTDAKYTEEMHRRDEAQITKD